MRLFIKGRPYHRTARGGIAHTFASAERWLREHADRPFFLLVHTYEVHTPYRRRDYAEGIDPGGLGKTYELTDVARVRRGEIRITPTEIAYLRALYDGGVRMADRHVQALLDTLEALGLADRTLVVVTSDHGEAFGVRFPHWAGDHGHTL